MIVIQGLIAIIWGIRVASGYICLRLACGSLELCSLLLDILFSNLVQGDASPSYPSPHPPAPSPSTPSLSPQATLSSITPDSTASSQDSEDLWESFSTPLEELSLVEDIHNFAQGIRFHPSLDPSFAASEDYNDIPWIARWEAFRLYQTKKWPAERAIEWLNQQQGKSSTQSMTDLRTVIPSNSCLSNLELKQMEVWSELDDEETARRGTNIQLDNDIGAHCIPQRIFGGVYFPATLTITGGDPQLLLGPARFGLHYRYSRVVGSSSIIRVSIEGERRKGRDNEIMAFFVGNTFEILGKRFQAMAIKDDTLILVETSKDVSLYDIFHWHSPLDLNHEQLVTKWAARLHLGFSTTEPLLQIPPGGVEYIDDFDGKAQEQRPGKIPDNQNMTDGCGYANDIVFKEAQRHLGLSTRPTALQFRFGGAKGMLLSHSDGGYSNDQEPRIWLRPSQIKIKHNGYEEPAQRVLEIVTASYVTTPSRVSPETILNLHHNGVPARVFIDLNEKAMQRHYDALTQWEGVYAQHRLYKHIFNDEGVLQKRQEREINQVSRARGFRKDLNDITSATDIQAQSIAWYPDPFSECPSSLPETILELLRHGFTPRNCSVLEHRLKCLLEINTRPSFKHGITIPMSARVHCAPVPERFKHLLKMKEVYFRSSKENLLRADNTYGRHLGDKVPAVVMRNPCKLPSDSQKVTIMDHPELSEYTDVMLMSLDTDRSLCSLLAGGDYDGDGVMVIWDPTVTDAYEDPTIESENYLSDLLAKNFISNAKTVQETIGSISSANLSHSEKADVSRKLQEIIFESLTLPNLVSKYSDMHNKSIEQYGYSDERTKRLGFMAATALDLPKTGLRVHGGVLEEDLDHWNRFPIPSWVPREHSQNVGATSNPMRSPEIDRSVMFAIQEAAKNYQHNLLQQYPTRTQGAASIDPDLCAPWEDEAARIETLSEGAELLRSNLKLIKEHVQMCRATTVTINKEFTKLPIEKRQDILRHESKAFMEGPHFEGGPMYPEDAAARLKASYAYIYDFKQRYPTRWPWNVAHGQLCRIKASSTGGKQLAKSIESNLKMGGLKGFPE